MHEMQTMASLNRALGNRGIVGGLMDLFAPTCPVHGVRMFSAFPWPIRHGENLGEWRCGECDLADYWRQYWSD